MNKLYAFMFGSVVFLLSSLTANATSFDFIAPSNILVNQQALGPGIGTSTWGLLVATETSITLQDLENAVVTIIVDNQNVTWSNNGRLMNESHFAPLLPSEVAGYIESGPVTDNSSLLSLLNPGETLKNTNAGLTGVSIQFPDDFLGIVNVNYDLAIGNEHINFTTQLNFVSSLPSGLWWEITDGARLTSTSFQSTIIPEPPTIWLFASGIVGLVGLARRKTRKK